MAITYNSLIASIENYLERSDASTIAEIPTFIANAEQKICREAKTIGLEKYVTGTFGINQPMIQKPARWRRTITFNLGVGEGFNTREFLELRTYEFVNSYWSNRTLLGTPKYYCDYEFTAYLIAPTPDEEYPFELGYIELPVPLTENQQTNWLTNYAPDVLLYGALLESIPFLKNDERIPVWEAKYSRGIESLTAQDKQNYYDRTNLREAD